MKNLILLIAVALLAYIAREGLTPAAAPAAPDWAVATAAPPVVVWPTMPPAAAPQQDYPAPVIVPEGNEGPGLAYEILTQRPTALHYCFADTVPQAARPFIAAGLESWSAAYPIAAGGDCNL